MVRQHRDHEVVGAALAQRVRSLGRLLTDTLRAFATLAGEIIIVDKIYPEWKTHSNFIDEHLKRALALDALRSSHPIEVPCPDSAMINQIFDA